MWEAWVWSLDWEDILEEEIATPLQYFCLENPHEQKSLAGYSPWSHKESDMTEWLSTNKHVLQLHELQPIWLLCPPLSPETETEVAQSCLTLCDTMDCSLPGSSIHGIFQATVLEWVAISFSRGSSQTRDRTLVSCIAGRHFTVWATREALCSNSCPLSQWCCLTVLFSAALILLLPSIFPSIRVFSNESPQVYIFRIIGKYYT